MKYLVPLAIIAFAIPLAAAAGDDASPLTAPAPVQRLLNNYCIGCHSVQKSEGDVRLDTFSNLDAKVRLDLLNKLQEQIHFSQMPPQDEKQPDTAERKLLAATTC